MSAEDSSFDDGHIESMEVEEGRPPAESKDTDSEEAKRKAEEDLLKEQAGSSQRDEITHDEGAGHRKKEFFAVDTPDACNRSPAETGRSSYRTGGAEEKRRDAHDPEFRCTPFNDTDRCELCEMTYGEICATVGLKPFDEGNESVGSWTNLVSYLTIAANCKEFFNEKEGRWQAGEVLGSSWAVRAAAWIAEKHCRHFKATSVLHAGKLDRRYEGAWSLLCDSHDDVQEQIQRGIRGDIGKPMDSSEDLLVVRASTLRNMMLLHWSRGRVMDRLADAEAFCKVKDNVRFVIYVYDTEVKKEDFLNDLERINKSVLECGARAILLSPPVSGDVTKFKEQAKMVCATLLEFGTNRRLLNQPTMKFIDFLYNGDDRIELNNYVIALGVKRLSRNDSMLTKEDCGVYWSECGERCKEYGITPASVMAAHFAINRGGYGGHGSHGEPIGRAGTEGQNRGSWNNHHGRRGSKDGNSQQPNRGQSYRQAPYSLTPQMRQRQKHARNERLG